MCVVCISACLVSIWIPCNYPVVKSIILRYDTVSLGNHFLTNWRNITPLSSGALRSRLNETFRQVLLLNAILLRLACVQLTVCILIFDGIFPVWTNEFSHMQIHDCVGVCVFLEYMVARQIFWLPENNNHCFLSSCWVTALDLFTLSL